MWYYSIALHQCSTTNGGSFFLSYHLLLSIRFIQPIWELHDWMICMSCCKLARYTAIKMTYLSNNTVTEPLFVLRLTRTYRNKMHICHRGVWKNLNGQRLQRFWVIFIILCQMTRFISETNCKSKSPAKINVEFYLYYVQFFPRSLM